MKLFKPLNILMLIVLMLSFSDCSKEDEEIQIEINTNSLEEELENFPTSKVYLGCLKGMSGIGMANLMQLEEEEQAYNSYKFTITDSIDELTEKFLDNKIQIAALPTNIASDLYNKTNGNVQIAAINSLGGFYVIENGDTIKSIKDLADKTIYISDKESLSEYIFNYILNENSVKNVKIEYKEPTELFSLISSGKISIGVFSEPHASAVMSENPKLKIALDLNEEWKKVSKIIFDEDTDKENIPNISEIMTECIAVRKDYSEKHPRVFGHFLQEYYDSISKASQNPSETTKLAEKFGIVTKADIAEKSIANDNITYIDSKEMEIYITNFLTLLYNFNPDSIGGKVPPEDFFYVPKEKYAVQKNQ